MIRHPVVLLFGVPYTRDSQSKTRRVQLCVIFAISVGFVLFLCLITCAGCSNHMVETILVVQKRSHDLLWVWMDGGCCYGGDGLFL